MKAKIIDYKKYIDHLLTFNALLDPDGNVLMANRTAIEAAGLSYDDVIGKYFPDIRWLSYDPQAQKRVANTIDRAKKGDTIIVEEKGRMAETDVIVQLSLKPVFDEKGKVEYIIAEGQDITRIKEAEKELRKSHELINAVSNFVGIVGIDGKLQLANKKTTEHLGFAEEEVLGINFWECGWFVPAPETVGIIKNSIDKALDGKTTRTELKIFTKQGQEVPIFYSSTPMLDDSGKTIGIAVEGVDISAIVEREARLAQSEAMYRDLVTHMHEGLGITDAMGNFTFVNPMLCEMLEYSAEELVRMNVKDFLGEDENRLLFLTEAKKRARGEFSRYEITYITKSGKKLHVFTSASPIMENGVYKGTRAVITDLTRIKEKEELLQKSEAMYRDLVTHMHEGLGITDAMGNFTFVNPGYCEMLGYSQEELLGMNVKDILDEENRLLLLTEAKKRAKGQFSQYELTYITKSGKKLPTLLSASPIMENGVYKGSRAVITDLTALKGMEAKLLQAQKMEAVGILAGGVAHDFNNILQAIFGYTQILMLNKKPDDPELRYLQTIEKSAQKASALIKQLLTFGRKVESHLQPVNLNLKIKNVTEILSRTLPKMIGIELHLAEDLKIVNADPIQIEQIIMNLGINAADAMPDGGRLIFETENVMLDEKYINSHLGSRPGEYVLLSVSDTGAGMDQETLQHIFEPFFTTKAVGQGTGLGLAMVYGIVKSHNGYITCYSEPGQGTTFKIYLPTIETLPAKPILKIIENEELPRGSETILLVDDEEALRNLGQEILQGQGFSTLPAESGERAIEIYQEKKDRIDLIILDVSMPGMGGHRCFQELKKINPQVKVIVVTGYSANGRVKEMIKSGAAGFIGKPYRLADILNKIREVLDTEIVK